jgi:predicted lysophospholipase L1 biosynthesis ABC-type transport system permease subunit
MIEKFRLTEVWCKIALLFVFSTFYFAAIPFPEKSKQFPQLLALVSLVMTVIALVLDFTRKHAVQAEISDVDDTELKVLDAGTKRERRKRYYQTWAIVIVSTGVGFLGGFLFSALCLFAGFGLISGSRQKLIRNTIVAVATTIVVYLVFGLVMKVPLLAGILW